FVASQMNPAVFDQTTVDIDAKSGSDVFWFRVTGSVMKFDGFLKVYEESKEGKVEEDEALKHKLPPLEAGQKLTLKELKPEQHFTEPPPRYNEASLVKELEEQGIGRPSTYATILSTIQERQYVQKDMENIKRMEKPTEEKCERCGSPLVLKWGRHGSFYACSAYKKDDPESCTFTKENPIDLPDLDTADLQETTQEEYCENCGRPM